MVGIYFGAGDMYYENMNVFVCYTIRKTLAQHFLMWKIQDMLICVYLSMKTNPICFLSKTNFLLCFTTRQSYICQLWKWFLVSLNE